MILQNAEYVYFLHIALKIVQILHKFLESLTCKKYLTNASYN